MPQAADGRGQYSRKYLERERQKHKGMTDEEFNTYLQENEMSDEVLEKVTGRTKWFNSQKGYGFIVPDKKGSKDVFVHYSALVGEGYKALKEGDKVEFRIVDSDKGLQAKDVEVIVPVKE